MAGPHRIRLTSLEGQGEMSVVVETPGAQTRWTMKGQSNTNYDDLSLHLNNFNVTPEPYLGVDQVSVTSVIEGVSAAGLEAELPTEAGNTLRSSTVDILQIDDAAIQGRVLTTPGDLGGWNQLYYREVITTFGLELADGSTVTEGTVPCHLEISGTASRDDFGPHGWVFFIYKVAASVLEPGTPLSDDPVTFIGEAPTPIGAVEIQRVSLEDWPTGSTNFTVESESFNLPVCGQVAFFPQDYESALEWRITNMTGNQAAVSLNARLVCDDPGVKLIYRK
jgi:hypothetical protein